MPNNAPSGAKEHGPFDSHIDSLSDLVHAIKLQKFRSAKGFNAHLDRHNALLDVAVSFVNDAIKALEDE